VQQSVDSKEGGIAVRLVIDGINSTIVKASADYSSFLVTADLVRTFSGTRQCFGRCRADERFRMR
jgi:hypothetical protein